MSKKWQLLEPLNEEDKQLAELFSKRLMCPEPMSELFVRRGFKTIEELEAFLNPSLTNLHDPFLFEDMEKSVDRILVNLKENKKIGIFGDYDADGAAAASLLCLGLRELGGDIDYYLPHRIDFGYGISVVAIEQMRLNGADLVISVDCGVNAIEEVEAINHEGIDIIITDHHEPKDKLPEAYAILNPRLPDNKYPFKELAGVGVAYKLLMAIYKKLGIFKEGDETKYLDIVAVGTIADIVPLIGENRTLVVHGIEQLKKKKNCGLSNLIEKAGLSNKNLTVADLASKIVPRINAAGRMGSACQSVELMTVKDVFQAHELADSICNEANLRHQIELLTFDKAKDMVEMKYFDIENTPVIILASKEWHQGVTGIVADKLANKYSRPVILFCLKDEIARGSGRSVGDINLLKAIQPIRDLLNCFGGYSEAIGLTLHPENLEQFETRLTEHMKKFFSKDLTSPTLKIDNELKLSDINENLVDWINKLKPFGNNNKKPMWLTKEVIINGYPEVCLANTLKFRASKNGYYLDFVGYDMGNTDDFHKYNSQIDVVYSLSYNYWQDKETVQARLVDILLKQ